MSALRSTLLEWDADRASRILIAVPAVSLAAGVTDGFLVGLGTVVLFAVLLDGARILGTRVAGSVLET